MTIESFSPEQNALWEKIKTGNYSFIELTLEEQQLVAQTMRPTRSFSFEQKEALKNLYLVALHPNDISNLNAISKKHKLVERTTISGEKVTPGKVLTNIREGEPFYFARESLSIWKIKEILPEAFPASSDLREVE
jgi:hypothetical protein